MTVPAGATVLRLSGLAKAFPGVQALREASLDVRAGEVHALVGENGAGKSTLLKIVTGAHAADRGLVELDGVARRFAGPRDARRRGMAAIYQELSLVPALSVRDNLFLGVEPRRGLWLDEATERRAAAAALDRVGAACDPEAPVRDLSVAAQQLVEIARALLAEARLLILDEPTAALTPRESERLLALLDELRARGLAILFVSHRLDEVLRIADRVTVMRDGATLGTWAAGELTRETLIERMVGRSLDREYPKVAIAPGAPRARGARPARRRVRDVSFIVRAGEVLGIAGLVGAGRTETGAADLRRRPARRRGRSCSTAGRSTSARRATPSATASAC